jgi:hypothetical protein
MCLIGFGLDLQAIPMYNIQSSFPHAPFACHAISAPIRLCPNVPYLMSRIYFDLWLGVTAYVGRTNLQQHQSLAHMSIYFQSSAIKRIR